MGRPAYRFTCIIPVLMIAALTLGASTLHAVPSRMYVGTYAISNDTANGDWNVISIAEEFWRGAFYHHPWLDQQKVVRRVNLIDHSVTISAISNNALREDCDFLFVAAHSSVRLLAVWNNETSGMTHWLPPNMDFGTNQHLKWVFLYGCDILRLDSAATFWPAWDTAFSGVQCVLGYASGVRDMTEEQMSMWYFWERWTTYGNSIWNAHKYATYECIYANGNNYSISPAIISSSPASYPPYPTGAYSFADMNWANSTHAQAHTFPCETRWVHYTVPEYPDPPDPPDFIPPVLVAPASGTSGIGLTPLLQWQPIGGSATYVVELFGGTDEYFCDSTTSTTWQAPRLDHYNFDYYWRVGTITSDGTKWSEWWYFITMQQPTPVPAASLSGLMAVFLILLLGAVVREAVRRNGRGLGS